MDTEIDLARLIGGLRTRRDKDANTSPTPYGKDLDNLNIEAVGAEIAFCKMMNLYPDLTTRARAKGADCTCMGFRIDVKHTNHPEGRLLVRQSKHRGDCDVYVLVRGIFPDFDFVGWCFDEAVFNRKPEALGEWSAPAYVVPNEELQTPDSFRSQLWERRNNKTVVEKQLSQEGGTDARP